jgi:hypothetical protein
MHPHRAAPARRAARRAARLGWISFALAILMAIVEAVALGVDGPGRYSAATVLALVADGVSVATVVVGIVALIRGGSRVAAALGIAIGVLGNPLVLLYGLGAIA